jgi:hypothetical protein
MDQEWREIVQQKPRDIDEAISCMQRALKYFHKRNDNRAIFLRLYCIMTLEVHAAINGLGEYKGKRIFLDPSWIESLSGKFASLYFKSLTTFDRNSNPDFERAWKITYKVAKERTSTVLQNALLGINVHINYDLANAISQNLRGKHSGPDGWFVPDSPGFL